LVGNVGDSGALAEVVKSWTCPTTISSTKEILNVRIIRFKVLHPYLHKYLFFVLFGIKNAEKGGYAVGAFNVYNLEGVDAVVSAAEETRSPAILQVRSNQLKILICMCSFSLL